MSTELVKVYGTEKSRTLKTGGCFEVTKELANTLVAKGSATFELPEEKEVKTKKEKVK